MMTARSVMSTMARVAAAALVALLASVGFAGTASAAAGDCPSTYACIWRDANYVTNGSGVKHVKFFACHHDFRVSSYAGTTINANDSASSVSNRGTQASATFYVDNLYKGTSFTLAKGTGDGNLSDSSGHAPGGFNDKLSSGKFTTLGTGCR